jgi:hypothetical protein
MGERDQVWEHEENLFPGFKCKYCVKEFRGGGATRLKEHLAEKSGNVVRCTKCPPDIQNYFLCELQRVRERKKAINDERLHRVQSTIPESNDEDEELQEVLEVLRHEAEFQRRAGQHYEHDGGSGDEEGEGEVESKDCLGEPRPRGKVLETLMPQEPRHQFKLG